MSAVNNDYNNIEKSNNGPQYPTIWQYNLGDLKTVINKIGTIALFSLGGIVHLYLFHNAIIIVPVVLLLIEPICKIREIYCRNLGKAEYDYSKTLPNDQSQSWLKKAAEHKYVIAIREYGFLKNDRVMISEAAHLGDTAAVAVIAFKSRVEPMDLQLKWKLSLNTETFPRKPQDFIDIVKYYSFSDKELTLLKPYINTKIREFGFTANEADQIRQEIGLSSS